MEEILIKKGCDKMKIKNLIKKLSEFDGDKDVKIGVHQKYISDTAYEIDDVCEIVVYSIKDIDNESCVAIYVGELSEEPYNTEEF